MDAPMANELAAVPIYMIGSAITESGRNGSGAWVSRQTNANDKMPEPASRAMMGSDSHGYRVPPQVSARSSETAAAIIRPAPRYRACAGVRGAAAAQAACRSSWLLQSRAAG